MVRRRLRDGLVGLCVLAWASTAPSFSATAAPTGAPSPSAGTVSTAPALPTASTRTSYATSASSFSVTVSPARLAVGQDALDSTQPVTVVNRGREPVSLTVSTRDFVAEPDGGLNYQPDAPYGAADWVRVSKTHLELQPGASDQVDVTFDVPAEPEPGDHQVALVFLAPAGHADGNIQVSRGIGAPVYVTVPGPTDSSVRLNSLAGPGWVWRGRPSLTASLSSTGTVHRDFRGPTALSVGTPGHESKLPDFTVVRGSDRSVSTDWQAPLVCVCHPSVTVTNADGVRQTVSARVVVLPWWVLAGLLLVVLAGVTVLLSSRRRHSRPGSRRGRTAAAPVTSESG